MGYRDYLRMVAVAGVLGAWWATTQPWWVW